MNLTYRKATPADLDLLVETRLMVIGVVWQAVDTALMRELEQSTRAFYRQSLTDGSHTTCLAFHGDELAAIGGICYFRLMPTPEIPAGHKAYIMNMHTRPNYQRRGVASRLLGLLIQDAKERGVACIALEASAAGKPLYAKFGFKPANDEMILYLE